MSSHFNGLEAEMTMYVITKTSLFACITKTNLTLLLCYRSRYLTIPNLHVGS